MYSPSHYRTDDQAKINAIISSSPLATLIYGSDAIHLPLIRKNSKLIGHMARRNQAWKEMHEKEILVIFHGPQGYVSATWYESEEILPTWNYVVIHIRGKLIVHEDEVRIREALEILGEHQEPNYDLRCALEKEHRLLKEIVAFEIDIHSLEAKFKLAQQKPQKERLNVVRHLRNQPPVKTLADAMEET